MDPSNESVNESVNEPDNNLYTEHATLKIKYPAVPFVWHYNDFANPYPVHELKILTQQEFAKFNEKNNLGLDEYINETTEFYLNKQYRMDDFYYMNQKVPEIYVNYHTWLMKQLNGTNVIEHENNYYKFNFLCKIVPIQGDTITLPNFPHKIKKTKFGKKIFVTCGMNVGKINVPECKRTAIVHNHHGIVRFSPYDLCNFFVVGKGKSNDNIHIFCSIISNVVSHKTIKPKCDDSDDDNNNDNDNDNDSDDKSITETKHLPKSCITIHVFRKSYASDNIDDLDNINLF
jgi:hypothetical protein